MARNSSLHSPPEMHPLTSTAEGGFTRYPAVVTYAELTEDVRVHGAG